MESIGNKEFWHHEYRKRIRELYYVSGRGQPNNLCGYSRPEYKYMVSTAPNMQGSICSI